MDALFRNLCTAPAVKEQLIICRKKMRSGELQKNVAIKVVRSFAMRFSISMENLRKNGFRNRICKKSENRRFKAKTEN